MTDSERLNLILSEIQGMKTDMHELKQRTNGVKSIELLRLYTFFIMFFERWTRSSSM